MKKFFSGMILMILLLAAVSCAPEQIQKNKTITFMNGGEIFAIQEVKESEMFDFASKTFAQGNPQKQEDENFTYSFSGWAESEGGERLQSVEIKDDLTVYALFESHEKEKEDGLLTVTFMGRDDSGETLIEEKKVKEGENAAPPENVPAPTGYRFTGWDKDPQEPVMARTLYVANYEKCRYFLVRHILGETFEEEIEYETPLEFVDPPRHDPLVFEGWYREKECTSPAEEKTMPAFDLHIYAKFSVDFSGAHLSVSENMRYGNENLVKAEGLIPAENISYSYLWQDFGTQQSIRLENAGESDVSVKITANVDAGEDSFSRETTLSLKVTVDKKPLKINLGAGDIVYGETPSVTAAFEGLVKEEDEAQIHLSYLFYDESNTEQSAFFAGRYRVEGRAEPSQNYEITQIAPAEFTVRRKTLTLTATAENKTYGAPFAGNIAYEGFLDGEDETALSVDPDMFVVQKEGEAVPYDRLCVGEYTVLPRLGAFSSQNYEFAMGEPTPFSVAKAVLAVEIIMDERELVYGTQPQCAINHEELFYGETEEEVFGAPLAIEFTGAAEPFHVGSYEARVNLPGETENYEFTSSPIAFTIVKKQVTVSILDSVSTFGDEFSLPEPVIEGVIEGEESILQEIRSALTVSLKSGEQTFETNRFLRAGDYAVAPEIGREFSDYEIIAMEGSHRIDKRAFAIQSGEVSQNRNSRWEYTPTFAGAEAELFKAEGLLVLDTNDAGTYTAEKEDDLARNHFRFEIPLKFLLMDDTDVTNCFLVSYSLNITLNNSRFSVTLPFSQRTLVYDGTEHEYPIQVKTDDGDTTPYTVRYTVNGLPVEVPKIKNAGEYEIVCEISAQNYSTETKSYRLVVEKAQFTFLGETSDGEFSYSGEEKASLPTLKGVGEEDVSQNLRISVEYTPVLGEKTNSSSWISLSAAGEYRIALSAAGNPNYNDLTKNYSVKITRIRYDVEAPDKTYTYDPNATHTEAITVRAVAGNPVKVLYDSDGAVSESAPSFHDAIPEGKTVKYTVSEGNNYEETTGEFKVTILKKKGTLDVGNLNKYYIYSGEVQTIDSGAVSNNPEDATIVYENNTFTTVAEGNSLTVTVRLLEGKNYTGAEEQVTGFHVEKKTFQSLPFDRPAIGEQYNRAEKRLKDVLPPSDFVWKNGEETLVLGEHEYEAFYNPDPDNCNDFATKLQFSTRKERIGVSFSGGEGDIGSGETALADYSLTGENGSEFEKDGEFFTFTAQGNVDYSKGGTYPVTCELQVKENDYFEVVGERAAIVPFKLKSAEYDSKLYTLEDALHLAESGTITVKKDTVMMKKEEREKLNADPYGDESFFTVKSGVKLLVPYREGDAGSTAQNSKQEQKAVAEKGFCGLVVPSGVELKVKGKFIVNALRSSDSQRTSMVVGSDYATLELQEGATVRVLGGGEFESMGFTFGKGEVYAENGSSVYEPFAMVGWKGGSISAAIRNDVFPINQYALSSLEAKTHFSVGSNYILRASLSATLSLTEQHLDLEVLFLGGDTAFLSLKSGEITKELDETKRALFEVKGEMTFHNLELKLNSSIRFNTEGLQVPIPGNIAISLKAGTTASVPKGVSLKLLPGATAAVETGATLNIEEGGALLGYGKENVSFDTVSAWQDGHNNMKYPHAALTQAYRGGASFNYKETTPATVRISGTLDAKSGSTVAAELTKEEGGNIIWEEANKELTLKEDYTPAITSLTDKFKALQGQGGVFFQTTLKGKISE